jgi:Mn2+/Fe2+ NRAMP family transporter
MVRIEKPPAGLGIFVMVGPGIVWAAEYIGAGEATMAPRVGALFGVTFLWLLWLGILFKYFIGLGAGKYTVITGEGMIDMFSRIPGPKNWLVWLCFAVQFCAAMLSPSAVAILAGTYGKGLIPIDPFIWGWILTLIPVILVWSERYDWVEKAMSILVLIMVIGVVAGAIMVLPPFREFFLFELPEIPSWARGFPDVSSKTSREVLPLLGWGAGGFASHVWYTYWVQGKGYGMAKNYDFANPEKVELRNLSRLEKKDALKLKGWTKVVTVDATTALIIGIVVSSCFMIMSAGTLHPNQICPSGQEIGIQISNMFEIMFGSWARYLFLIAVICTLLSTQIAHFSGWPRMLSDCLRVGLKKKQNTRKVIRIFILIMLFSNMLIIYSLGAEPYQLAKIASVWDGLIFIPLQAVVVWYALFRIVPKFLTEESRQYLKQGKWLAIGLFISAVLFTVFAIILAPLEFI